MIDALDITDEEARGLGELAALDLAMARSFAARAQAAEDPEQANDFARSYQRMARSYRQTLALKLRLKRERDRAAREADDEDGWGGPGWEPPALDNETEYQLHRRKVAVRAAVTQLIFTEAEPLEVERLLNHLEDDIEPITPLSAAVLLEPEAAHVERLAARMRHRLAGLRERKATSPAKPVEPDTAGTPPDPAYRSSA